MRERERESVRLSIFAFHFKWIWIIIRNVFDIVYTLWTIISKNSESHSHARTHARTIQLKQIQAEQKFCDCNNEFTFTSLAFISIFKDKLCVCSLLINAGIRLFEYQNITHPMRCDAIRSDPMQSVFFFSIFEHLVWLKAEQVLSTSLAVELFVFLTTVRKAVDR